MDEEGDERRAKQFPNSPPVTVYFTNVSVAALLFSPPSVREAPRPVIAVRAVICGSVCSRGVRKLEAEEGYNKEVRYGPRGRSRSLSDLPLAPYCTTLCTAC